MLKVTHTDLESVTKFLDKIANPNKYNNPIKHGVIAKQLSKMIKDKYTEIKPDYERKS